MLLIVPTPHGFVSNYSLNRHSKYVRQIIYILYEISTVQLASVGSLKLASINFTMGSSIVRLAKASQVHSLPDYNIQIMHESS